METTLILIVVIVMLYIIKNNINSKISQLELRILELQNRLISAIDNLKREEISSSPSAAPKAGPLAATAPVAEPKPDAENKPLAAPIPPEASIPPVAAVPEAVIPVWPDPVTPHPAAHEPEEVVYNEASLPRSIIEQPVKHRFDDMPRPFTPPVNYQSANKQATEPKLSFSERHPDMEKFIGENLVNKIGIAILVLAIGYFVKFAIDNDWIGPLGRVGVGVLCGAILIGIAHRMRNSYTAFSSVLVGGGLAVLYFTITLAYHQFHLFNQLTSFIILIVITCFAVVLSILYNKQELAVIALIGGLVSPLMVSNDHANYHGLFIYLVILNTGLLVIAYNKSWRILNASAFGLTVLMFSGVLFQMPDKDAGIGLFYGTILYLLFFAINVAHNVKENRQFIASDFTILLTNTALYFAGGLYLLDIMGHEGLRGLFAVILAVINLLLSYILFRNKKVDNNILYLLIGITLTFISLAGPIQLNGHYITLFWAAETVVLYWLYKKSGIYLMQLASRIIWVVMLMSLFIDWSVFYGGNIKLFTVIANKGFITTVIASVSSCLLYLLTKKAPGEAKDKFRINEIYKYTALILLFLSGYLEIDNQFSNRYPATDLNTVYLMLYVPAFVYILIYLSKKVSALHMNWKVLATITGFTIFIYLVLLQDAFYLQHSILAERSVSGYHFAAHWLGALFTGLLLYQLIDFFRAHFPEGNKTAVWGIAATIVLFLSIEFNLLSNLLFYSKAHDMAYIKTVYVKTALPVLWGLISFAMMWLGMRYKVLTLRIVSLTLFSITLLKLFIFDISNIPPAGKIAAFFCLGILLLIISFMYQKVKKIIVADERPKED